MGVLAFALVLASVLLYTSPEAKKRPQGAIAPIVGVVSVEQGDFPVTIHALGEVVPAQQIELIAQASGEIIEISDDFVPGGLVQVGKQLLQIDPEDYRLEMAKHQANYDIELGQQQKARKELEIVKRSGSSGPKDQYLVLRGPQLKQVEADLARAKLNLSRTKVRMPFNAMVVQRHVNLGTKVTAQQALATLVGTDEYWVQLSVAVDQLPWLLSGEQGSQAEIKLNGGRGAMRYGKVFRIVGQLEGSSRLAPVLISIHDPLQLQAVEQERLPPLLLGDYVAVTVFGKTLTAVYRAPHHYIRNGNILWTARDEKMVFVPVNILHKDRDYVYFKAELLQDERIVTSNIATPINGMRIETKPHNAQSTTAENQKIAQTVDQTQSIQ